MWCQWTLQMRFPSHPWEGPRSTKPFSYFSTQSSVFWNVFHNTHSQAPKASLTITLGMLKQFSLISNAKFLFHFCVLSFILKFPFDFWTFIFRYLCSLICSNASVPMLICINVSVALLNLSILVERQFH